MCLESKLKHLEFIQNIIARMAHNSFLIKGWTVTLNVAVFTLSKDNINFKVIAITSILTFVFWILDSYFLQQERIFRKTYDSIRDKTDTTDFSMKYEGLYTWDIDILFVFFSKTLFFFYGFIILSIFIGNTLL